jgi:hypothetical protein
MRSIAALSRRLPKLSRFLIKILPLIVLLPLTANGQSAASPQSPPHTSNVPAAAAQEQFISYWTTEAGWHSEIQLRNNLASQDLTVTPALRTAEGAETLLSPVTIKPQEVKTIDIEEAVMGSAPQLIAAYGSVVLRYRSPHSGNLFSMLMIRNIGHSIAYHFDGASGTQDPQGGSREGIWWLPNETANDYLVLTNQGSNPLQIDLSLYDSVGKEARQKITLTACATSRLSVRQLVRVAGLAGAYGGIKIYTPTHAGSLDSLHILFDEKASFSALMKMFDQSPNTTLKERDYAHTNVWTLRAPMLALTNPDPAVAFPEGTTLQPQLFVRNTLGKPVDVALRFNWRSANSTGNSAGPAFRLGPYETRRIDVAALQAASTIPKEANWASVTLTTSGLPDEVVAVAASYDQTLRYGAQTPFSDQLAFQWKGSLWEYDAQHNSLITAGNGGTKPLQAAFTIYYNQGTQKYQLEQTLQPDEQMWIDVGKLIREHVLDKDGNALPADLTSGSYEFRDLTNKHIGNLFEGKVIFDKTYGHVTYGCGPCCGYQAPVPWYNPLGIPLSLVAPNGVDAYNTCDSNLEDVSDAFYYNWSTANGGIATVDYYGNHTGVAVGSTTSNTSGSVQTNKQRFCPALNYRPSAGANVQIPKSLKVLGINILPTGSGNTDHGCTPGNDFGIELDITYQVLDGSTPPKAVSNATMVPHEHVVTGNITSDNDICPSRISTCKPTTDVNGIFHDAPLGGCGNGSFADSLAQNITIILNGTPYPVRTNNFTVSSSSVTHGSISNGSDIIKTR